MSTEENRSVVRRFFAGLDAQDLAAVGEVLAPGYRLHFDSNPEMNREAGLGFFAAFLAAFPDLSHWVEDQVAEENRVATRLLIRGTQQQPMMGLPATGKPIAIGAINIMRLDAGQIAEHWISADMLGLWGQLGVAPPRGGG